MVKAFPCFKSSTSCTGLFTTLSYEDLHPKSRYNKNESRSMLKLANCSQDENEYTRVSAYVSDKERRFLSKITGGQWIKGLVPSDQDDVAEFRIGKYTQIFPVKVSDLVTPTSYSAKYPIPPLEFEHTPATGTIADVKSNTLTWVQATIASVTRAGV